MTESPEILDSVDVGPDLTDEQWAAQFDWAVATVADVMGYPPGSEYDNQWALYDAGEDDPPIAVFDFRETAEIVCRLLNKIRDVSRYRGTTNDQFE